MGIGKVQSELKATRRAGPGSPPASLLDGATSEIIQTDRPYSPEEQLRQLTEPKVVQGRNSAGFNPARRGNLTLFTAMLAGDPVAYLFHCQYDWAGAVVYGRGDFTFLPQVG
jgi:hypothetical protein